MGSFQHAARTAGAGERTLLVKEHMDKKGAWQGEAILYCEGAFASGDGKTSHGLVRFTRRFRVAAVIDSTVAGRDAGDFLDRKPCGIPLVSSLQEALTHTKPGSPVFFVVGIAVLGGRLAGHHRAAVAEAIRMRLNVVCGLHDFLSEDAEFSSLAQEYGIQLIDVRKPPLRKDLHAFSGKIDEVTSFRVAALGTDSAIGKRTTAWRIVQGFESIGVSAELIGTGQTAWMQGARYSIMLDSLINDFVAGELEHAVWRAWSEQHPEVLVVEGQGGLLCPGFPGGFEILAATRPHVITLQHAPARVTYEDFPKFPMHPLDYQIRAIEMISSRPVVAITLNHQGLRPEEVPEVCRRITKQTGLPCIDVLEQGPQALIDVLQQHRLKKA